MEQPVAKRYFSKIPGSKYIFQDGSEIIFHHGRHDFNPDDYPGPFISQSEKHPLNGQPKAKVYQDELEYLCKSGNPLIFDQGNIPVDIKLPDRLDPTRNAQSEANVQRQDAALRTAGKVVEMGEVNSGGDGRPSDPNVSAVDPALQAALFNSKTTGHGASKIEQLKAAALDRQNHQTSVTAGAQNKNGMS